VNLVHALIWITNVISGTHVSQNRQASAHLKLKNQFGYSQLLNVELSSVISMATMKFHLVTARSQGTFVLTVFSKLQLCTLVTMDL
jgi:hypothetical protein